MSLRQGGEPELQSVNVVIQQSIPERFEEIVRAYADRLAIKMGERSLSYSELNHYANRIARQILEKRGSGSEPIALLFEHGIDIVAAILGVLKAEICQGGLDIYPIPGDHDHCVPDNIARVAQILKQCLVNARVA